MVSNLYLKFSELQLLEGEDKPFGNIYGATSSAVLTEFMSPQEIIDASEEELLSFLADKSRNRISDLSKTSELLQKAARDSYRLDKCMYEPLNISLASSFNCIHAFQKEMKLIEQAIEKCISGMNPNALIILQSIPGIGPVWASGIISEIGDAAAFHSSDALAKYAGLYWPKGDSGDFTSEDNKMSKAGNPYLRYYLGEAANSVRKHVPEYAEFYAKKYAEVTKHQHKRALALTSRKFVRLVFGLLVKNQLYTGEKTNCTPAKSWTPNLITNRTDFRFLKNFYRGSLKVTLFSKIHIKTFFKKFLTYHQNASAKLIATDFLKSQ